MNPTRILGRAFEIVRRYPLLWLLGILLALTSGSGAGSNANLTLGNGPMVSIGPGEVAAILSVLALLLCAAFLVGILLTVLRYIAEAALIRSVDQIEEAGLAPGVGQAFGLGWSWRTVRLFLIDLLITIPFAIAAVVLVLLALSPLFLMVIDSDAVRVCAGLMTVGTVLVAILFIVVAATVIGVLKRFIWRAAVLNNQGVVEAFGMGWSLVRQRWQDVSLIWLLMFGIALLYGLAMIPITLLAGGVALLVGGGLAVLVRRVTESAVLAILAGGPIGLLLFLGPLLLVGGLYLAYESTVWTLAYRAVREPYG